MQRLAFSCRCGSGIPKLGDFVLGVEEFCSKTCLEKACRHLATHQSVAKARDLGMTFDPEKYHLPTHLESG